MSDFTVYDKIEGGFECYSSICKVIIELRLLREFDEIFFQKKSLGELVTVMK
jgi:hypothetical protein